jgi:DNA-binding FrmR family transcriptional regulator
MIDKHRAKAKTSLKKAHTHIEKIIKMMDSGEYCPNIMQQLLAVQGYIKSANATVLESHLHTCAAKKLASKDEKVREVFIQELVRVSGLAKR